MWNSFEFGSGRILRFSSLGFQEIIFEVKIMIYEHVLAKETCRMVFLHGGMRCETKVMSNSPA